MSRKQHIRDTAARITNNAVYGSDSRNIMVSYIAFMDGAEWADAHPNPEVIKKIFSYALKHTNILLAADENKVDWELLIKYAMEE